MRFCLLAFGLLTLQLIHSQTCDGTDPAGTYLTVTSPGACNGTATDATCGSFGCTLGYSGGSATCNGDGSWTVVDCVANTDTCDGTDPAGTYLTVTSPGACNGTATDATCGSFDCTLGYSGGSATCNGDGSWTVVDCVENVCSCLNGTAALSSNCEVDGAEDCTACDVGFQLNLQACDVDNDFCSSAESSNVDNLVSGCSASALGGSCSYTCSPGYSPVADLGTCGEGGSWENVECDLDPTLCPALSGAAPFSSETVGCDAAPLGGSCEHVCSSGYTANVPICTLEGWDTPTECFTGSLNPASILTLSPFFFVVACMFQ